MTMQAHNVVRLGDSVSYTDEAGTTRTFTVVETIADLFRLRDATGDYVTTDLRHPRWTLGAVAAVVQFPVRRTTPQQRRRTA